MARFTESVVEDAALAWFDELGYSVMSGADLQPDSPLPLRTSYHDTILAPVTRECLRRLNPDLPEDAVLEAFRKLSLVDGAALMDRNRAAHRLIVNGVPTEYRRKDGSIAYVDAKVIDFARPEKNEWLAVNQYTIVEGQHTRRPDVIVFVNGLPLGVVELKNAGDPSASVWDAWQQLQIYQMQIPSLFAFNAALLISDGVDARIGAIGGGREWFKPWRTLNGIELAPKFMPELEVQIRGVFEKSRFLDLVRYFVAFEDSGSGQVQKKLAGYHQFHAVNVAVSETIRALSLAEVAAEPLGFAAGHRAGGVQGDRRVGVVWHTQGSGKSLTMAYYAGRAILHPALENPTLVVITDRNDLDDQLFGTFARCRDLLRQDPVQAADREDLRQKLAVASGGVVFTTIQKFLPEKGERHPVLSTRRNIIVIADEAHRSQYGFVDGFARHMRDALPGASFIGFTGTPVELTDANTRAVFGEYISVYDIQQAVIDKATVPIYYEGRLAKLVLKESERPKIDSDFEEVTEGEEVERKEKLKSQWARLEALVGSENRVKLIARDLVEHFESRLTAMDGKGMIVCMSRRICVELFNEIAALRPAWGADPDDDSKGFMKIVMTGSAMDPAEWQVHLRSKKRREDLAKRFRNPDDPFRLVLVRDMWLTGFDAPSLHTMYIDKPMQGHGLMQAIARVNRVFRDKPGGLVVDYLGLADKLKEALATYTESGGQGETAIDQAEAIAAMVAKYEVCRGMLHGFSWAAWASGTAQRRLSLIPAAREHLLKLEDGKSRFVSAVNDLSRAFALAVPSDEALKIRDDVGFFQAVRAAMLKGDEAGEGKTDEELSYAVRQIVSGAVASEGVIDIFSAAGLKKPDISILSDEFLMEVREMPLKNVAVELLRKLLSGEIRARAKQNIVQSRSFAEMLEEAVKKYQNRAIGTAQVIEELIALAKEMREANARGEELGLSSDELAFYDALETNDSAVKVLGEPTLKDIARELVTTLKNSVTIDWTLRENVRAEMRVRVKRILRKYGYPPDKQEKATQTVLQQAELLLSAEVA